MGMAPALKLRYLAVIDHVTVYMLPRILLGDPGRATFYTRKALAQHLAIQVIVLRPKILDLGAHATFLHLPVTAVSEFPER